MLTPESWPMLSRLPRLCPARAFREPEGLYPVLALAVMPDGGVRRVNCGEGVKSGFRAGTGIRDLARGDSGVAEWESRWNVSAAGACGQVGGPDNRRPKRPSQMPSFSKNTRFLIFASFSTLSQPTTST